MKFAGQEFEWPIGGMCEIRRTPDQWLLFRSEAQTEPARPLVKDPAIFRNFADLKAAPLPLLAFATDYGFLDSAPPGKSRPERSESIADWLEEIWQVREAVVLWDLLKQGKPEEILGCIARKLTRAGLEVRFDRSTGKDQAATDFPGIQLCPAGKPLILKDAHLSKLHQKQPSAVARPLATCLLEHSFKVHLAGSLEFRVTEDNALAWSLDQANLKTAIWAQMADAFGRQADFRSCEVCRRWFELAPEIARSDRLFCSNACRTKSYRDRQAEAIKLHQKGHSVATIAEEVGSTVEIVDRWIKGTSGAGVQQSGDAAAIPIRLPGHRRLRFR